MQGHSFTTPTCKLEIRAYDIILGMDWLSQFSHMTCHWQEKHVTFVHKGEQVTLQGVRPKATLTLQAIEPKELYKLILDSDM